MFNTKLVWFSSPLNQKVALYHVFCRQTLHFFFLLRRLGLYKQH